MTFAPNQGEVDSGHLGGEDHFQTAGQDRRITDLMDYLLQTDPLAQNFAMMQDPKRSSGSTKGRLRYENSIVVGKVVHAIPYFNWYKVQIGKAGTFMPACMLGQGSFTAMGVRPTSPIAPNSVVLCFVPYGLGLAFILGTVPGQVSNGDMNISDWIQQGGGSGMKRDKAHSQPIKNLFREGGVKDFSNRRPVDATAFEWGYMSETGTGLIIDPFQVYMRINEACGIFFNYWDSYCRLAGMQMDFQTFCQHAMHREDEGENLLIDGRIVYPWEALGLYGSGEKFTEENSDKDVHYKKAVGKVDLKEKKIQPFYRYVEYGGYLGQPMMRMVVAPPKGKESGVRKYDDDDKDIGLFQESIALDGSYFIRSAKTIIIGKRVMIPVPKRKKLPEDGKDGDDATKDNYKFSGKHGGGDPHKVGDIKVEGDNKSLLRVGGVLDILTYHYNWKSLHPFHYHKNDYKLWQESELTEPFDRSQDRLDFYILASRDSMEDPKPKKVKIDHRYGEVDYYQRESFLVFHEDGGVQIGCGFGGGLAFAGGNCYLDVPGTLYLRAGKRVLAMGWDVIIRSHNSVDISANKKDIRLKAEGNMQFLAGNGKKGGMLFECRSTGSAQIYQGKYGEDVQASGIVFLTKKSEIGLLAKDIYIRTGGGGEIQDGRITIDASKGKKPVSLYGKNINVFANKALQIFHSPQDETCNPDAAHRFAKGSSMLSGNVILEKNVVVTKGNLLVKKNIGAGKNIIAQNNLVHKPSPFVGAHQGKVNFDPMFEAADSARQKFMQTGQAIFQADYKSRWYTQGKLGAEATIQPIGFSFRDPPGEPVQYKAQKFQFPEARWQQMVRMGLATGGTGWTEKPVTYQGQETYPFPGKKMWCDEPTMAGYKEFKLYDGGTGKAKDRPGPYEDPQLAGSSDPQTLQGNWKIALE